MARSRQLRSQQGPCLEYFFEIARRGQIEIWTSAIAYVEVFKLSSEEQPFDKDGLDAIKEAIEANFVKIIPLDMEVGRKARGLRRNHPKLRAPDAIHLASALIKCITPFHTWDNDDLLPFDNNLSCKDATRLRIMVPEIPPPTPGTLFAQQT